MRNAAVKAVALGGMLAALAVVIMSLGGMIPLATFVLPVLCMVTEVVVLRWCGRKLAWVWFAAVAILSLLLCPDKEAAAVFVALGYYPIIKPSLDGFRLRWLWKLLLFNGVILCLYWMLTHLFGMAELMQEFRELGQWGIVITLALGNATFFLLDLALKRIWLLTGRIQK